MTTTTPDTAQPIPPGPLRSWVMRHDDSWFFIVPYIGLAVLLSITISTFWLVAVVAGHFALELLRQVYLSEQMQPRPSLLNLVARTLWELKLDVALILFALVMALYLEFVLAAVGLGQAARVGAMAGARFTVLQRVLRGVFLSLDDLMQVARVIARRGKKPDADEADDADDTAPGWQGPLSRGDKFTLAFGALCFLLIAAAPIITDHDVDTALATIFDELQPFPAPENGDSGE
jgi:hypothetical protein